MWMDSFIAPATLLKMNFFLGIFQEFCLKVPEDFFYHRTCILLQNTSLGICNNSKIIQNNVNNKINN